MKILFVTSECAPFSKSGGLADVAFSLPPALQKEGNEIAIITPLYDCVRKFSGEIYKVKDCWVRHGKALYDCGLYRGDRDGVTVWFVEYDPFFARPRLYGYEDDKLRFAFFSRAVIELLPELDFMPEILHCNDWETALAVIYLKNDQAWRKDLQGIKSVYTIHNIAYVPSFICGTLIGGSIAYVFLRKFAANGMLAKIQTSLGSKGYTDHTTLLSNTLTIAALGGILFVVFELATGIFNLTAPIWDKMSYISLIACGGAAVIYYITKKVKAS